MGLQFCQTVEKISTVITLSFRTPFVFENSLFFNEIKKSIQKHVFRTPFVFGHPLFFTEIIIF